jgi:hypothetical protein
MKIVELRLKKGNTKDVLEKLPKEYFYRFYRDPLGNTYYIYTYFDDCGFQYDALIPIYSKGSKTLKARVCKYYFEKFIRDPNLFYYVVEDIENSITEYIKELENTKLE